MPEVWNMIEAPGGAALTGRVSITLVGTNANPIPGYVSEEDRTIESNTNAGIVDGYWSVILTPNARINPSGTRYKVQEDFNDDRIEPYFLTVPDGAGPYYVEDILDVAPTDVAQAALAQHLTGLVKLDTAQTIIGVKTFAANPIFNDGAIPSTKISGLAPNSVTLDTDQTITGTKTFKDRVIFASPSVSTEGGGGYATGYATGYYNAAGGGVGATWPVVANDDGTLEVGSSLVLSASRATVPVDIRHTGSKFGAFGNVEIARPTVSGDTDGNEALQSLLLALHSLGWIVNNTSGSSPDPYSAGYESGY